MLQSTKWWFEQGKTFAALNVQPTVGILLHGPPGTGKSLIMKALVGECRTNHLSVDVSDIIHGHVGQSEKRLTQVFMKAQDMAPCIVLFDELDVLFGSETAKSASNKVRDSSLLASG